MFGDRIAKDEPNFEKQDPNFKVDVKKLNIAA